MVKPHRWWRCRVGHVREWAPDVVVAQDFEGVSIYCGHDYPQDMCQEVLIPATPLEWAVYQIGGPEGVRALHPETVIIDE